VLLDSGCQLRLGNPLQETLGSPPPPRARAAAVRAGGHRTTGIADLSPIAATPRSTARSRHYQLGGIVTTVDAMHGIEQIERFPEAARQVACADRVIVTKGDLADPSRVTALDEKLAAINPHAPRLSAVSGDIPPVDVLVDMLAPAAFARGNHDDAGDHDHAAHADHVGAQGIATTTIRLAQPLPWPRYAEWVDRMQKRVGDALLRVKGVVRMDDGHAYVVHAAMRLFSAPAPVAAMPAGFGDGVVVVITQGASPGAIDGIRRLG
jgi:G3E family GTPase